MKQIQITRTNNTVNFQTVSIDVTEFVFFTNLDPQEAHFPTLTTNQLGPAPSPNSSQCAVPQPDSLPGTYPYKCSIPGHENEQGEVNVNAVLAAPANIQFSGTVNVAVNEQVVVGGFSPYQISGELFQVVDSGGNIIDQGSGSIGPGLSLSPTADNSGVYVVGSPTMIGTYSFTFTVNDSAQHNLQQVQYSMAVAS
jgi:hypothetical protein